jgi:sugar phosphate isomerase/epimerase
VKLGAITSSVAPLEFESGLELFHKLGLEAVEVACGGFFTQDYADMDRLLNSSDELKRWLDAFERHELEISALAIHGEPLTPNKTVAGEYARQFRQACQLAEASGIDRLTLLAGLPEGAPGDSTPCWIVSPFPDTNMDIYYWQWEERVIPYWREQGKIASDHGCRLCFEMEPGDVVYNPAELMKLRAEVGPVIGCNFDPSHLVWQGIDVPEALRFLSDAIYHVHAKDVRIQEHNVRLNGVLDPKPLLELTTRAWSFRTAGYGHDELYWRDLVSTLKAIGYDDVLSIEHEDQYMDAREGLEKAASFLRSIIPATSHVMKGTTALRTQSSLADSSSGE